MRTTSLFLLAGIMLVGCQAVRPNSVLPAPSAAVAQRTISPEPQRLPAPVAPTSGPASAAASPAVQPAAFEEPISRPKAEPETLPQMALKPVNEEGLTLAELEQMALGANPSVSRASALVEAARGNWVQVGLPFNPSVGYEGQQLGSRGLAQQDGVFVNQEFVMGGKLQLNRQIAAQEIAKAASELEMQQQRVLTDVRMAFNQVLIAQRQAKLTEELRSIAAEGVKTADALMKGKEVGRVDVVQSQLELENANILVQNATNRSRAAWQTLATVVGNGDLTPQPLAGDIEAEQTQYDLQSSLQRLLTSSPEIASARAEIERTRWAAERARVEKIPNLNVQGLMNWRDDGIGGRPDGAVMVGVPLPLFNRNQGAMIQASQQAAAAERALAQLELSLQNRLAPVYERYANAKNQVEKYRTNILPAARESLQLTRQMYQAGEAGYINLLTAQRTYSQTNLNYLESLRELRAAEAEIDGLLLSGSLQGR